MFKKILCTVLTASLLLGALSACTTKKETTTTGETTTTAGESKVAEGEKTETSKLEPVTLKMYFIGEPAVDNEMVFNKISDVLEQRINARLEPLYLSWGDYLQRYPLLFSSGEDFDMIFTAAWAFYSETASKGGFAELTPELLEKNAPLVMKTLPKNAWDSTKVNGKNYMIPYNNYWANHFGVIIRGDLRKKYNLPEVKTVEDLENYMQKIVENEPGMVPIATSRNEAEFIMRALVLYPQGRYYLVGQNTSSMTYDFTDANKVDLKPFYEVDGYVDYLKRMREWNQKGYFSKSDLTATTTERFQAGKSAVQFHNIGTANTYWQLAKKEHPDWEVEYVNLLEGKKLGSSGYLGNGLAFNARSKNLERAIMAADLLNYDPELNFLINSGIPGVHSEIVGKKTVNGREYDVVRGIKPDAYGNMSTWCFANTFALPEESFDGYAETCDSYYYHQKVDHPLDGMTFVTDSVNTQVANNANVMSEYIPVLYLGFAEDPEATLAEFKKKLKDGGEDEINAELEKQAQSVFEASKK